MQLRRSFSVLFVLGFMLSACAGGSGSSGFDNFPNSENAAIQAALDEQRCVEFQGLSICPADTNQGTQPSPSPTTAPTGTPTSAANPSPARTATPLLTPRATATPTPTSETHPPHKPVVDTGIHDGTIPCAPADSGDGCILVLPFAPDGFPGGTVFRLAVRTVDPPSVWTIGSDVTPTGSPSAPAFDASVAVNTATQQPAGSVRVQLAVLAFLTPPASVPTTVEVLGSSGADYAFVTGDLSLQSAASYTAPQFSAVTLTLYRGKR